MGDVDHCHARLGDGAHLREQPGRLRWAEGSRGFVEDEQLRLGGERLQNCDELARRDRQLVDRCVGVDASQREPLKSLEGPGPQALAIDRAKAGHRLTVEEDILGHRKVGDEGQLLEDDCYPGGSGRTGVGRPKGLATEDDLPSVRRHGSGDDLYERRLTGAVLADQGMDFTWADVEADFPQSSDATERLAYAASTQDLVCVLRTRH